VYSFVLTNLAGEQMYATWLIVWKPVPLEHIPASLGYVEREALWAPRCYSLVHRHPCFSFARQWLALYHANVLNERDPVRRAEIER
jgi:hypothetical protein